MKTYTAYQPSPVGLLAITVSDEVLQAVVFAADETAAPSDAHPLLAKTIAQLTEYFEGSRRTFDLPLGQQGTAFQQQVWELLTAVPYGKTISYQQLSKRYGDPKAIRAVAAANGKNNLAIVVPCHRIIGSDQSLTGYAGGLWRKRWLLAHEARYAGGLQQLPFN